MLRFHKRENIVDEIKVNTFKKYLISDLGSLKQAKLDMR